MFKRFGVVVFLVIFGLGMVGLAQDGDGSAPYPSKVQPPLEQPEPQFCWVSDCCIREETPLSDWETYYVDTVCVFTWRCLGPGTFFAILERMKVKICCTRGVKCFGFCVDPYENTRRCWEEWKYRTRTVFIGCGCYPSMPVSQVE